MIQPINNLLAQVTFDVVCYSLDWHPSNHISFIDNLKERRLHESSPIDIENACVYDTVIFDSSIPMKQTLWPRHCVENTWGSQLHKDLKIIDNSTKVYKGTNSNIDSYSAFSDNQKICETILGSLLDNKNVTDVYLSGIAYDICVAATAFDAISNGYRTILLDDCCRGVDFDKIDNVKQTFLSMNGIIVDSKEVNINSEAIHKSINYIIYIY